MKFPNSDSNVWASSAVVGETSRYARKTYEARPEACTQTKNDTSFHPQVKTTDVKWGQLDSRNSRATDLLPNATWVWETAEKQTNTSYTPISIISTL